MENSKLLLAIFTYNNGDDLKKLIERIPNNYPYDILVHVDGSDDGSDEILNEFSFKVIRQPRNFGIGRSMRSVLEYSLRHDYEAIAVIPGNNKNDPVEVSRLFQPIIENKADYVQGSRYLKGSRRDHTPIFRLITVKLYALFLSILTFRKITDALEGFRAFRLSIFDNPSINIEQDWLNTYGLETYLFFKIISGRKYRYVEVPVSKIYPKNKKHLLNKNGVRYSHIRPFVDWWHILKPIFFLIFKIKK